MPTILVVDDEAAIANLLRRMLEPEGYSILSANSAKEALAAAEQQDVDLLLTDVRMPEVNGYQLASEFSQRWPDKPVLYMSGYTDAIGLHATLGTGVTLIEKPFRPSQLLAHVAAALAPVGRARA